MARKYKDVPIENEDGFDPENEFPSKLEHFPIYNAWARKNKKPVRVPDESFYPKVKVRFMRFQQPENVLKTYVRTKDIEWKGQLRPGGVYELAVPVVKFLNNLSEPIFSEVKVNDGGETITETKQVGERARFSCQMMELV